MSAPYQAVRCADGHITIGAANDRTFLKLAAVLDRLEWTSDARFDSDARRVAHRAELARLIEEITVTRPCREWLERLDAEGVPCGPINTYAEAFADPQVIARGMAVEVHHPTLGALTSLGTPLKMSATPLDVRRRAPRLGEHTAEVLREFGLSAARIEDVLQHMRR